MQRYLRRTGTSPAELFVWTPMLANKTGFEEVWAADADDAAKSPPAPQLDSVGRSDLRLLERKTLAAYAAFRLELELDPSKLTKDQLIEKICAKQGWDVPEADEVKVVEKLVAAKLRPMGDPEVVDAIEGAASTVAKGTTTGGEACVLMMMQKGGFIVENPFDLARRIDARALELLSKGEGSDDSGKPADNGRTG